MSRQPQTKARTLRLVASASAKTAAKCTLEKTGWACTCSATGKHLWPCLKNQMTRRWKVTCRYLSLCVCDSGEDLFAVPVFKRNLLPRFQTTQGGSSTEDSKGQKGKEGGKASFPCPFCDKVFPRAMRLMVHMQIHSGEKPYSYRQRKEPFYSDPTRPRVADTDKAEVGKHTLKPMMTTQGCMSDWPDSQTCFHDFSSFFFFLLCK